MYVDETQPLLGHIDAPRRRIVEPLVDFDPTGDPENPLDWPKSYKRGVVFLLALMSFIVTFTCIGIVPVAERIVFDLGGRESKSASILLVTVWELGEAAGPLIVAPLSEMYGRYPVLKMATMIFILGVVLSALSQSSGVFIFSRFLTGFATASNVLNPAIIGDMFAPEARGSGMSLIMLSPLLGGAIGPAISGTIAETLGWRAILWMSAGLAIVCEILFFMLLRETYKVPILQQRAARLRKMTKNETFKCAWETEGKTVGLVALKTAIKRPVLVMLDSSVLQILSFYGGLVFTIYYIMATTLPSMLRDIYGFSPAWIGYSFLAFSVGASGGISMSNLFLDNLYVKLAKSRGGVAIPEHRLLFMVGGGVLLPGVVALYGWVPYAHWPVYLLLIAVALIGFFIIVIWIPLASYVVDSFGIYSASGMTIVLIARCLGGTLLPLAIPPLIDVVGLGYGFLISAAICFALVPLPVAVMLYGRRWRQKSMYTRDN